MCKAPAVKGKTKCRFHGGKSTGARTEEGIARIAKANTTSGKYTKKYLRETSKAIAEIRACEDILFKTNSLSPGTPRSRGRKPKNMNTGWESLAYLIKKIIEEKM